MFLYSLDNCTWRKHFSWRNASSNHRRQTYNSLRINNYHWYGCHTSETISPWTLDGRIARGDPLQWYNVRRYPGGLLFKYVKINSLWPRERFTKDLSILSWDILSIKCWLIKFKRTNHNDFCTCHDSNAVVTYAKFICDSVAKWTYTGTNPVKMQDVRLKCSPGYVIWCCKSTFV